MAYVPSTGNGSALAAQNRANVMTSTGLVPWLVANSIPTSRGMMSEIGIPGSSNPVIDPNYDPGFTLALQQLFLDFNSQNMHVTLWSGGEWRIDLSVFLNVDGSNKPINYRSTVSSVLLQNLKGANGVTAGRGFNLWGAEASDTGPSGGLNAGTLYGQYYFPQTADFAALASVGITELRLPYRMERLQPTLLGAFNTTYLAGIQQALTDANTYGIKLYLDPHNYGRYDTLAATNTTGSTSGVYMLGQNAPSSVGGTMQAAFVDHMVKLVNATKGYAGLWGWGLNNEPHDLPNGNSDWFSYCRAAVEAIRLNDQTHYIFVGGYNYQGFGQWSTNNGSTQWLTETIPAGQAHAGSVRGLADDLLIWDGHMYFDYDGTYSGSGSSFTSLNGAATSAGYAPYNNSQPPAALDITSQTGERQVFSADEGGAYSWTAVNPNSNTLAFTTLATANILKVTTSATSDEGGVRATLDNAHLSRAVTVNFGLPVGANLSTTNDYTIAHFWDQHYYAGTGIVDLAEIRVIGTTGGYKIKITQPSGSYLSVTGTATIPYSNTALHSIKLVMTDTGFSTYIDGSSTPDATFTTSNTGNSFGGLAFGKFYGTSYIGDMYYGAVTATQPGASYDAPPNGGLFYTPSTTTTTTTVAPTTTTTTTAATTTTTTTVAPTTTTTTTAPTTTTTTTQSGYHAYSGFQGSLTAAASAFINTVPFSFTSPVGAMSVNTKYRGDMSASAMTVTLPATANPGDQISVQKIDSSSNYLTINGNVDGLPGATYILKIAKEGKLFEWSGSTWLLTAGDLSFTVLDALYQRMLVSGTNLKTVNGVSLLGSGNLTVASTSTITDANGVVWTLSVDTDGSLRTSQSGTVTPGVYTSTYGSSY